MKHLPLWFPLLLFFACIACNDERQSSPPKIITTTHGYGCGDIEYRGKMEKDSFVVCGFDSIVTPYSYKVGVWEFFKDTQLICKGAFHLEKDSIKQHGGCPYTKIVSKIDTSTWWFAEGYVGRKGQFLEQAMKCEWMPNLFNEWGMPRFPKDSQNYQINRYLSENIQWDSLETKASTRDIPRPFLDFYKKKMRKTLVLDDREVTFLATDGVFWIIKINFFRKVRPENFDYDSLPLEDNSLLNFNSTFIFEQRDGQIINIWDARGTNHQIHRISDLQMLVGNNLAFWTILEE